MELVVNGFRRDTLAGPFQLDPSFGCFGFKRLRLGKRDLKCRFLSEEKRRREEEAETDDKNEEKPPAFDFLGKNHIELSYVESTCDLGINRGLPVFPERVQG